MVLFSFKLPPCLSAFIFNEGSPDGRTIRIFGIGSRAYGARCCSELESLQAGQRTLKKTKTKKTMEKTKNMLVMRNIDANTRTVAKEYDNDYDLYIVTQCLWMES